MPFDIFGWVEATSLPPEEGLWRTVLSLDFFDIGGDAVSEYLFGLSKGSQGRGVFADRGVPADCTGIVREQFEKSEEYRAQHDDGEFGHTFASLEEIRAALAAPDAPTLDDSAWAHALDSVEFVLRLPGRAILPSSRFIVWASW